jgi:glucokinase-like ROK family protein
MTYLQWENTYIEKLSGVERKKFIQEIKTIKYLYVNGPKTNSDICKYLKISIPKSFSILNDLIASNLIEKQGRGVSKGGRKPDLYGIKDNSLFILGIEMDRFKAKIAVFNNNNENISGIHSFPILLDNDPKTVEKIYEFGSQIIASSGIDPAKIIGIGISAPGLIDSHKGINYTYLYYGKKSICEILQTKFNRPVFIENDAKAAALAEHRFGLAHNRKDVLVILLDWGIGLGLILDGKLYRGTSGFAGEFSHIPMVEDGVLCNCGKHGCLETIASGVTLARLAKEGIKLGKSSMLNTLTDDELDKIEAELVVDAAKKGDQYAINILSEVGYNLGKGISILISLYNPELIILGGRIAEAGQYITTPIQQSLNIYCMRQLSERTSIVISEMGQNVGIMGAVAVAMEKVFENYVKAVSK